MTNRHSLPVGLIFLCRKYIFSGSFTIEFLPKFCYNGWCKNAEFPKVSVFGHRTILSKE